MQRSRSETFVQYTHLDKEYGYLPGMSDALMPLGLIDEYRLLVLPIVLSNGKRLFKDGIDKMSLSLVDNSATSNGNLILIYRPAAPEA